MKPTVFNKCLETITKKTMASLLRKVIDTPNAPAAVGPYSQAILLDRTLYVSGMLGLNKDTKKMVPGGVAEQAKQALVNLGEVLKAGGSSYDKVVKTTVLLADMKDFPVVNEVYKQYFTKEYPARACYQVAKLPLDALVEIEAIAATGEVHSKM